MTIGDITYVIFDELFMSESYSSVYYVTDGKVYETAFSRKGSVWPDENDSEKFSITDSSYDMYLDKEIGSLIGHTWKKYYFFYDSTDDCIYEYAGTTIDMATVLYFQAILPSFSIFKTYTSDSKVTLPSFLEYDEL